MTNNKKKKVQTTEDAKVKGFLDMIAPSIIQFYTDHYICGNTFRCVWALREYPTATDEQAILRYLGEMDGVTLRIYTRQVTPAEEKRIISNAANKNRMKQGNTENLQETVTAAHNLQDVTDIIASMHRNREPLLHTAVYLELSAYIRLAEMSFLISLREYFLLPVWQICFRSTIPARRTRRDSILGGINSEAMLL